MKKGYVTHIEEETKNNTDYRRVVYTGAHSQLVLMSIAVGGEIGMEVHQNVDQFFRFEVGQGKVIIDGVEHEIKDGDAVIVPAGAQHNVVNVGSGPLKLYTLYSPPNHKDGTIQATKADEQEEHFDGITSE
ncbi:MAG: cupin domain-containing protein [Candidatus Kaiserbacteria bacterium]|nr:cupin domain-containing protein [Candidatus Kaiserbacteria bacterium]